MTKMKGAIFRMEEKDGKLYRVMYFKNNKGGLTRSKFIKEVKRKVKKKGSVGRPRKVVVGTKQVPQSTVPQRQVVQRQVVQKRQVRVTHPHSKSITTKPRFSAPKSNRYVRRSGSTQRIIADYKNMAKR